MTFWLILGAYVLGWLAAIRPAMKRRMLSEVCERCGHWDCGECDCPCFRYKRSPRGAVRERNGRDVAAAVWFAAWWPVWLAFKLARWTLARLGAGVKTAVLRATPLTKPELERRLGEQAREIDRLTAEIGRQS